MFIQWQVYNIHLAKCPFCIIIVDRNASILRNYNYSSFLLIAMQSPLELCFFGSDFNLIDIQYFFQIKNELRLSRNGKNRDKERIVIWVTRLFIFQLFSLLPFPLAMQWRLVCMFSVVDFDVLFILYLLDFLFFFCQVCRK